MRSERLFAHDPLLGITEYFIPSEDGESFTIRTEQDAAPIIEQNKREINEHNHTRWGDGKLVASLPLNIYWDLKVKGIIDDQAALRRWLNDPDNRAFRKFPGRV